MKVTVLMTLYNKGAFVREGIESVLSSTFTDFELLIIDDASTDDGPSIVRSIPDPRIRFVPAEKNSGRAASADRGYALAQGEYLAVLDADDVMAPERLARQVEYLDQHREVAVVGSWLQCFGSSTEVIRFTAEGARAKAVGLFTVPVSYPSCMFRTHIVQHGGVRAVADWLLPGEDHLVMLAIGEHGIYANLAETLTRYRVGEQNMAFGRDAKADRMALADAILRWYGLVASAAELAAHDRLQLQERTPLTTAQVGAVHDWTQRLQNELPGRRGMPSEELRLELKRRTDRLFYLIADGSLKGGWTYMLRSGITIPRLRYWASRCFKGV
ncbi:MAG: glycosyltransferase family 2 protein [Flavobacteriales bacterium]|nr:glycosyltransferase family 2 protein [Flavobacteriales bacterium]